MCDIYVFPLLIMTNIRIVHILAIHTQLITERYVWECISTCAYPQFLSLSKCDDFEYICNFRALISLTGKAWLKFQFFQFSRSVMPDSLWPHGLEHARLPCLPPTPGACSNSCPSSQWCHPTISSSVVPFSFCLQSFPASGSFQMSQFFATGGQSIGISASASVLPMTIQDWSPLGWTGWISLQSKGLSRVFCNTTVQKHPFFNCVVLIRYFPHFSYRPTWKDSSKHSKSK